MDVYDLLNVKFTLDDFVGETFFVGIPKVTRGEVNAAIDRYDISKVNFEKIGVDGRLHSCDSCGDFPEMTNMNDIYDDGTGVTKQELDNFWEDSNNG